MNEIWKDITGFEGYYQVSNQGRIKSLQRTIKRKGSKGPLNLKEKILTPSDNGDGYLNLCLRKPFYSRMCKVHRLVAIEFVPNVDNKPHIDHIDNNRKNNSAVNLRWVTNQENVAHKCTQNRQAYLGKYGSEHSKSIPVIQMTKGNEKIREYASMTEAANHTGIAISKISCCCNGHRMSAGGFKWQLKHKIT